MGGKVAVVGEWQSTGCYRWAGSGGGIQQCVSGSVRAARLQRYQGRGKAGGANKKRRAAARGAQWKAGARRQTNKMW